MAGTPTHSNRYKRTPVKMPVRLLIENVVESKGVIIGMSVNELTAASRHQVKKGDEIVAYINGRDRVAGVVSRTMGNVFAIKMTLPKPKQERLIELLMVELAKRDGLISDSDVVTEKRFAIRRKVSDRESICVLPDKQEYKCSVIDISLTGLGIEIEPVLKIGQIVRVGRIKAKVVRKISNGYGLELVKSEHAYLREEKCDSKKIPVAAKKQAAA
ncbi:MAG: PilZ domain-containing protein [Aquisalinus sp.]|nr:PilZ domain-containing protein [Aquisalinus sp.]